MDTIKINNKKNHTKRVAQKLCLLFVVLVLSLVNSCVKANDLMATPSYGVATSSTSISTSTTTVSTVTKTATPTLNSLSLDKAQSKFQSLLKNNGGCKLPCFWGITPGKSLYHDAVTTLAPLSSISEFTRFEKDIGAIYPDYTNGVFNIHTNIDFLANPNTGEVNQIGFNAQAFNKIDNNLIDVFESSDFNKLLSYYLLPNILTENGSPTSVFVSTMAKLPSSGASHGGFNILILYPEQGILINYTMQMFVDGENIKGCPTNSHVELKLFAPNQTDSFFDLLEPSGWKQIIQNVYKPLDEATSMLQEDFYRIFSQPTDECILTPANLWPVPD